MGDWLPSPDCIRENTLSGNKNIQWISPTNAAFSHLLFGMVHCWIWDRYIVVFMNLFLSTDKMRLSVEVLILSIVSSYLCGTLRGGDDYTYISPTPKPLQCHEIRRIIVRSTTECALYCTGNLYSCAGYLHDRKDIAQFQCDVCYIYYVKKPLVTIRASSNKIINMPELNKETGEILDIDIILNCLLLLFYNTNMCKLDVVDNINWRLFSKAGAKMQCVWYNIHYEFECWYSVHLILLQTNILRIFLK